MGVFVRGDRLAIVWSAIDICTSLSKIVPLWHIERLESRCWTISSVSHVRQSTTLIISGRINNPKVLGKMQKVLDNNVRSFIAQTYFFLSAIFISTSEYGYSVKFKLLGKGA